MWSDVVVVDPPSFDLLPGVVQTQKPVDVQALVPERAVERFDERIVGGSARPGKVHRYLIFVCPPVQSFADELTAVVGLKSFGNTALGGKLTHDSDDLFTFDALVSVDGQAFPWCVGP